jgi:hypothetical protein
MWCLLAGNCPANEEAKDGPIDPLSGSDPDRVDLQNKNDGTDVRKSPDGRGARFDQNGKFTGFLEPR